MTAAPGTLREPPALAPVAAGAPETLAAIRTAHDACYAALDPALLELVSLHIASMVHRDDPAAVRTATAVAPEKVAALADWPTAPAFSDAERACLAFAEQFVVSVGDVDDALVAAVLEHLEPDELFALVNAMYLVDATERLDAVTRRLFPEQQERS